MTGTKYIGMDVHKESISIAVMSGFGKIVMECVIETKASMVLQCIHGLRGELCVTFEEGTWAAWLYDLLKPHVTRLVVCDPRRNALLQDGDKNDRIDARKLAELLYLGKLHPIYHGEHGLRALKELVRSYLTITKDLGRVMTRVKAIYRSWSIPCTGKQVYAPRHRGEWLPKISEPGVRRRAEFFYQQLDALRVLRQQVRRDLLAESKKHRAWKRLCQIPSIGPIRAAVLLGIVQTPHRFRTKRPLWKYSGLGIETHSSADHRSVHGQLQRAKKQVSVRGLNRSCNHDLKNLFKGAAVVASSKPGPFQEFYAALLAKGMRPEMARLTHQALLLKCYVDCGSLRRNQIQPTPCSAHDHRYVKRTSSLIVPQEIIHLRLLRRQQGISTQSGLRSVVERRAIMQPHEPRGERNRAKIRAPRRYGVTFEYEGLMA